MIKLKTTVMMILTVYVNYDYLLCVTMDYVYVT